MAGSFNNRWVRRLAMWVLAPVALIYGFIQFNYPTCTFRYKLTAEVMTPTGLKTGSSVIEVSYTSFDVFGLVKRQGGGNVTGEAVYVDLGQSKNLFVLLGADRWERKASETPGNYPSSDGIKGGKDRITEEQLGEGSLSALWLPVHVFKVGRKSGYEWDMQHRANALLGQPAVKVPFKNLPLIGSFTDLSKPESFEALIPNEINKVLGEGYVLHSVKMEMTGEINMKAIRTILPWLSKYPEPAIAPCNSGTSTALLACKIPNSNFWADRVSSSYLN